MTVQAWFGASDVTVEPGSAVTVGLSVQNLSDRTDSFTLVPAGLTAGWTTVETGSLTLFAGSTSIVNVTVRPPALPTTSAGPTVLAVRVLPQQDPDAALVAETTLDVQPFDDRRIVVLQPIQRARRRVDYEFMVENHGNELASCRLRLIDATSRVDGDFDPPAVGVAPGDGSLVRLRLKAKRGFIRRVSRTLEFQIEAEQQGHAPATARAALVRPPTIPGSFVRRVVGIAALVGAAAAAWFAVVRPEIRDSAEREVDERVAELGPTGPTTTQAAGPGTTTLPPEQGGGEPEGDPLTVRLPVQAGLGATETASFQVPAATTYDVTDIVLQTPAPDQGEATLFRNSEVLYVWNLANYQGFGGTFEPRITPIRFVSGDTITFQVRCDGAGDPVASACSDAVLLNGRADTDG